MSQLRNLEKENEPTKTAIGPYDKSIYQFLKIMELEFKNEKEDNILSELIRKCLEYNPKNRVNFIDLKNLLENKIDKNGEIINNLNNELNKKKEIINAMEDQIKILIEKNSILETDKKTNLNKINELTQKLSLKNKKIQNFMKI